MSARNHRKGAAALIDPEQKRLTIQNLRQFDRKESVKILVNIAIQNEERKRLNATHTSTRSAPVLPMFGELSSDFELSASDEEEKLDRIVEPKAAKCESDDFDCVETNEKSERKIAKYISINVDEDDTDHKVKDDDMEVMMADNEERESIHSGDGDGEGTPVPASPTQSPRQGSKIDVIGESEVVQVDDQGLDEMEEKDFPSVSNRARGSLTIEIRTF